MKLDKSSVNSLSISAVSFVFLILVVLCALWLFALAMLTQGEYGDGYGTISNSKYLFSNSPQYFSYRGPLAAIALWPVEYFEQFFSIHPLNVSFYHIYSSMLHVFYLICCWYILVRYYGASSSSLIAFITTILSVAFIAYSPFLSHDIIPGLLFFVLIVFVRNWIVKPTITIGILVVVLGACVVLIKQTYAIFWLAIICSLLLNKLFKCNRELMSTNAILLIIGCAFISAALSWFAYSFFIASDIPSASFISRPYLIIKMVMNQFSADIVRHGSLGEIFPWYLYFKNIHNYGLGAMLLVLPGLYFAFKSKDSLRFMVAICWLFSFIFILMIGVREVRYLLFLAPLTAFLIVPVIRKISNFNRSIYITLLLVVVFDFSRSLTLATASLSNVGNMQMEKFLMSADRLKGTNNKLFFSRTLSFTYLAKSPFHQDRFHGIFHFSAAHLVALYQGKINIAKHSNTDKVNVSTFNVGDQFFYTNASILREPPWRNDNEPHGLENFLQFTAEVVKLQLIKIENGYKVVTPKNSIILLLNENKEKTLDLLTFISKGLIDSKSAYYYFGDKAELLEFETLALLIQGRCFGNTCYYDD